MWDLSDLPVTTLTFLIKIAMQNRNAFRITGPLRRETTSDWGMYCEFVQGNGKENT